MTETQRKIIKYLAETPSLSARVLSEKIGISTRRAESNIKRLKELNYLIRHGSPKTVIGKL
ncbi:MAG: winged helix-turn-helix domain-containing protein [Acidaminococcaceae bacterium]|nr:winged helix-turn-helix domain-containing protein [Acidaminococcaceae bacterium]